MICKDTEAVAWMRSKDLHGHRTHATSVEGGCIWSKRVHRRSRQKDWSIMWRYRVHAGLLTDGYSTLVSGSRMTRIPEVDMFERFIVRYGLHMKM